MPGADRFSLAGLRALVTGGSRGIGRAIALAFARAGAHVALASRKQDALDAVARELGPVGVRVNTLAPGLIETAFSAALFQSREIYDGSIAHTALRRHGVPDDLVGTAVFLASDASAYVTGQTLVVDGGSIM